MIKNQEKQEMFYKNYFCARYW